MIETEILRQIAFTGGSTAAILYGIKRLIDRVSYNQQAIIIPKLSNLCNRTKRTEIAQGVILDELEGNGHPEIVNKVLDEFDRLGIPETPPPINPT